ncbi:MAG: CC0125/CC1285 family lipoprotein [Caulobacterales bacterium]
MKRSAAALAAVLALGLGLSACETATPYQPLAANSAVSGGFTDQKLDAEHFRVTFKGNSMTARDKVETYLLYRAAELTVAQGFDWFEMVDRHTSQDRRTYLDPDPFYGPGYRWGYWRPSWRFHGRGGLWRTWDPFWGDPFWADDFDVQTVDEYEATADIAMHHGPKPPDDPKALDAHEVMANLGSQIARPK